MKSQPRSIILIAAVSALAFSVLTVSAMGGNTPKPNPNHPDSLRNRQPHERGMDQLSDAVKISDLMGMTVKNLQDETLGDVNDIMVDLTSGRLVAVVISSGGFLGIRDELSAVPPAALRFSTDRNTLLLDASKQRLSNAPHFKANQWPDFTKTDYSAGVYRAYQVEPYFAATDAKTDPDRSWINVRDRDDRALTTGDQGVRDYRDRDDRTFTAGDQGGSKAYGDTTDAKTNPDNTGINVRDRDDRTLTAGDQGGSKADRNTTAAIRKEIIAADNMSMNARNVKIITKDGHVTLRGPVNTADEKRIIGEIANLIARSENVDNQLEVK